MRIAFFGTPAFAVPTLAALLASDHEIAAVYTRAPKGAGRRGLALTPSPVQMLAQAHGLAVRTPATLRDPAEQASFAALGVAAAAVVGYGLLLPPAVLAAPRLGCLNLHPSILPRWRGAAPIQRPILAGDTQTAAAIMLMEEGLDTGPVALEERVAIPPEATAGEMHDLLAERGAVLMVEALARLAAGTLAFRAQAAEGVVYAAKIEKSEARIDWSRPAKQVHDLIRGLSPIPGAWFEADFGRGRERVKVLRSAPREGEISWLKDGDPDLGGPPGLVTRRPLDQGRDDKLLVKCGTHFVELLHLQRAGRSIVSTKEFLLGNDVSEGTILS